VIYFPRQLQIVMRATWSATAKTLEVIHRKSEVLLAGGAECFTAWEELQY